jgi:hypothetical protein
MPGLFEELDIAGAEDNPWSVPDNTYAAVVSNVEVKKDKNDNMAMTFFYKVTDGDYLDRELKEYKRLPHSTDKEPLTGKALEDAKSYIKVRLASLGIPEERMNSVDVDDLIGIECYITVKNNKGFANVRNVTLVNDVNVTVGSERVNPFE